MHTIEPAPASPTSSLAALYFDGVHAQPHAVTLQLQGKALHIQGDGFAHTLAANQVQWPERTRYTLRTAHLPGGGSVQCNDAAAWDAWRRASGQHESWVVKAQQSWRGVLASLVVLVAILVAVQQWGLPMAAQTLVQVTPLRVDAALGEAALEAVDQSMMRPSKLPQAEQDRVAQAFAQAVRSLPPETVPAHRLLFRQSRIGPNALALPGGTMIMTDEMVALVGGDAQVLTAILAHELGHVRRRHGLRLLIQATVLATLGSLVFGDFSGLVAAVPVLLGHASYSRQAEHEADVEAVRLLKAARISPAVMLTLFEKIKEKKGQESSADKGLGIAFASHPSDAQRIAYFKAAAGQ